MKPYYELHITYIDAVNAVPPVFEGWSPSIIAGDIVLGSGIKHYFTSHMKGDANLDQIIKEMEWIADKLREIGLKVVRTKVELVLYNHRTP